MDRKFFFDSKKRATKKIYNPSNHSRSTSSKKQQIKSSARLVTQTSKSIITKKQKQIREAIEYRFAHSKIRDYKYVGIKSQSKKRQSHSSQMDQYKHLKFEKIINLKQYHEKLHPCTSRQKYTLRFKLKQNRSTVFKTEHSEKSKSKDPQISKYTRTPSQLLKKRQEWKFISIQLRNQQKSKNKKAEMKINSHRTINIQQRTSSNQPKTKSTEKCWEKNVKIPKFNKDLSSLYKKYKF